MAKRAASRLTVFELVAEASDFSREAWRACWLPILLITAGHTLQFLHGNMAPEVWRPGPFGFLAYGLMIFYVPLYGGLYRIAIGGRPASGRGPGGLQWTGVEWRLIAVGVVVAFLSGLSLAPFLAVMGVLALVLGSHRVGSVGPLGDFSYVAVASIPVWLLFFWLMAPRIARLMLGWAYSTAREKTEPFGGWTPAKRSGWAIAWGLVLAWIPLLLGYLTIYALTLVEGDALTPNAWPLPEALGAGILLGALRAAVVAPLLVGVLTAAFWLLEDREEAREDGVRNPAVAADLPPDPPEMVYGEGAPAADEAERAAAAAAAALSAQQAAELDLPASEVDHSLTEAPGSAAHEARAETEAPSIGAGAIAALPTEPEAEGDADLHPAPPEPEPGPPRLYADEVDLPVPEPAAVVPDAPEYGTPEYGTPEHWTPEPGSPEPQSPALESPGPQSPEHGTPEHHGGLAHALEAAAAAAAVAGAAALAAHEAQKAHEAHHAAAALAEAAPAPDPEPEAPPPTHRTEFEPLSPWPHSVLPPWPTRAGVPNAEVVLAGAPPVTGPAVDSRRDAAAAVPLARRDEPAHRFVEITELK